LRAPFEVNLCLTGHVYLSSSIMQPDHIPCWNGRQRSHLPQHYSIVSLENFS